MGSKKLGQILGVLVALGSVIASPSFATVIISNLAGPDDVATIDLDNNRSKGLGFTLPAGGDYLLDSIELRLRFNGPSTPIVQLSGPGVPNGLTLLNPTIPSSGTLTLTFLPPAPTTLRNSQTYWVVVSGTESSSFDWMHTLEGFTGVATSAGGWFTPGGPSTDENKYAVNATTPIAALITYAGGAVDLGRFLLNGTQPATTVSLTKIGALPTSYQATAQPNPGLTVTHDFSIPAREQTEPIAIALTTHANGSGSYGTKNFNVVIDNLTIGNPDPNDVIPVTTVVGEATTAGTAFGQSLRGDVSTSAAYAGLASRTAAGAESGATVLGIEARLLGGANSTGGQETVEMKWRARTLAEAGAAVALISDVVDLTGLDYVGTGDTAGRTDVYVLQMQYRSSGLGVSAEAARAAGGGIYLAWLDPNGAGPEDDQWENAVQGNFNSAAGALVSFQGTWAEAGNPLTVGSWGVDIDTHTVWAVLDHASEFAVVPEPRSMLLLGVGALGLSFRRWRRRSVSARQAAA